MNKTYRSVWNAAIGTYVATPEHTKARRGAKSSGIVAALAAAAVLTAAPALAQTSLVSACSGVALPPSVITDIVGAAVVPLAGPLDTIAGIVLSPLDLTTNLTATLGSIAAGQPIRLNVLDTNGNVVSPSANCNTTADSYSLNTPKGISIGGNQITGLGNGPAANAGELNSIAFGNAAATDAAAANSIAIGPNATVGANGANSLAIGSAASVDVANSVALGAGSTATTGAQSNYAAYGLSALQTSVGEVSVGAPGSTRTITNVAAGSAATDAVNVAQLQAVDSGAVKYDDPVLKMAITLGGAGGTKITNLAAGTVSATSTDAINGAQLYAATLGVSNNQDALGLSMANNLGGGATYDSTTGIVSAPSYTVYGSSFSNVGAAIGALQTSAPVQYYDPVTHAVTTSPTNEMTLVGADASQPVQLHNVAAGTAPTDAVNKAQLDAVQGGLSDLDSQAVKYDSADKSQITLAGTTSTDGGVTGGTKITNLAQGELSADSTDAVNGAQLYATNLRIDDIESGGGIKYFHANSTAADSSATGAESLAAGPAAVASGTGSVAVGSNAQATADGAVAVGQNSAASGVNAIAIGNGAVASGGVAVGAGAQAGNGGAAFGEGAVAMSAQQGTAIGNGAVVTADRGVALGAGSVAGRAGMNGATEKYSNVAVASTEGAVSVGSVGGERQITNVAGGTAPTDAVNVRQLDAAVVQANQYTDSRLSGLSNEISDVRKQANAGSASAIAVASIPQATLPGRSMLAAGAGYYQGQSAVSVGVSTLSDNARWVLKINGTANSRGDVGAGVGIGFHW